MVGGSGGGDGAGGDGGGSVGGDGAGEVGGYNGGGEGAGGERACGVWRLESARRGRGPLAPVRPAAAPPMSSPRRYCRCDAYGGPAGGLSANRTL